MDLFSGTGGFSWGFHKLGFKIKIAVDNWECAAKNYLENFPGTEIINKNIMDLIPSNYEKIDIIIGSPPCQQFSVGHNVSPIKYPDLTLIAKFFEFVKELKPKLFIMENVPNILNFLKFEPFIILNYANYGIPQVRTRVFFGLDKKPPITHIPYEKSLDPNLRKWINISEILNLDNKNNGYKILYARSINCYANSPYKTIHAPSRTITTRAPKIIYENKVLRDFTIKEMALAQGFPEDFKFNASKYNCYKMIGNAVSPKISYAIAKMIKNMGVSRI